MRNGEQVIGEVTSGTFGPTRSESIAMAYVDSNFAAEGTQLSVDLERHVESGESGEAAVL